MNRKIVLATVGSLGDLHPFLAVAVALKCRGFDPVIASYAEYRGKIEAAGIAFQPVRPSMADIERDLGMNRAQMTVLAIEDPLYIFRRVVFPYLRMAYDDLMQISQGAALLLTSSLAFSARCVAEKQSIPCVAIVLQPMMFLSAFDPPILPGAAWLAALLRRLGPGPSSGILRAAKWASGALFGPLRRFRQTIGLPPQRDPLFDGQFSSAGAIGLYSPALGAVQADFPISTSIVGFTWFDSEDGGAAQMSLPMLRFLDGGAAPLVMTLGSVVSESSEKAFRQGIDAARKLPFRIVVLVGEANRDRLSIESSPDIFVAAYAPHSLLFARATAIIHHGGIGTLAQALRSGQPQLIVPHFADQADNAARAAALGTARVLTPRRFTSDRVAGEIHRLLDDPSYRRSAEEVGQRLKKEDGAERAALLISRMLTA